MSAALVMAGGAAALVVVSPEARREFARLLSGAGVLPPAYVTAAHHAAMARLNGSLLGVAGKATQQATVRYREVFDGLLATRGFVVAGPPFLGYPKLTRDDCVVLCDAFLSATEAGVNETNAAELGDREGYRLTDTKLPTSAVFGDDLNASVLSKLRNGERPASVKLTAFGEAVLDLARERNRIAPGAGRLVGLVDIPKTHSVLVRVAAAMDDAGYLLAGKPAAHETIWDQAGGFAVGALGDVVGAVVTSGVFWVGALAFVAWRVLR